MLSPVRDITGVPFARALDRFGTRLAVVGPEGIELTYAELADRVSSVVDRLGGVRRLVLVVGTNTVDSLVAYLAALAGGHPVLLTGPDVRDRLVSSYNPDVIFDAHLIERRDGSAHDLHPSLAVLLSTSGSTGSPKLVRLSADNIQANASSIASYLDIRDTDRASAALPMHYCYGLSVINSNLLSGAGLLLTGDSVVDQRFWTQFVDHGGTSLHGVPYTFDLLDRVGFAEMRLPSLRYVTAAGGRLAPERVRSLASQGARDGWQLFVMYGQTEATARMAYLPPSLAASHPSTVGVAIPGGSFEISASGELIYRGPNVMLGYASSPDDLALGRTVSALPTGDLARVTPDGLYELVGRAAQFVKICGLRIDPRHVETLLASYRVACTGSDGLLVVATETPSISEVAARVRAEVGLPASHVRVVHVPELPRLPSGKIDYPAVARLQPPEPAGGPLRSRFADVLSLKDVPLNKSFVDLGGDSLSYVRMSIEIEKVLGYVPPDWHLTPVGSLERLTPQRRRLASVETNIVLRAVAITLIVGTHAGLFAVLGGAHVLLIVAGWAFARFCLGSSRGILRTALRIAVPSVLVLSWRMVDGINVHWSNVLLFNNFVHNGVGAYWFVEALIHILLFMAALLAVPWVRRFADTFALPLVILGFALLVNHFTVDTPWYPSRAMSTHGVLWFFALGWLAFRARTWWQKLIVLAVALWMLPGYFGDALREWVVFGGLAVLMLIPSVVLPRLALLVIGPIASASLYIYLLHYAILQLLPTVPRLPVVLICLTTGIAAWWLAQVTTLTLTRLRPKVATA